MSDFEKILPQIKDSIRIEKNQQHEFKFIGNLNIKRGHTLFKFNTETLELTEADIKREIVVDLNKIPHKRQKVIYEANCIYFGALNKKNAQRKIERAYNYLKK